MLNVQRLKGIHTGMKSGMLAAETILAPSSRRRLPRNPRRVPLQGGWQLDPKRALCRAQFRPSLVPKGIAKFFSLGAQFFTGGRGLIDPMKSHDDANTLKPGLFKSPTPVQDLDGQLYLDKLTGVIFPAPSTRRPAVPPSHSDKELCVTRCWQQFRSPCSRFCPGRCMK